MKTGLAAAIIVVTILAALHLAALFLPPGLTWGFHFLEFLGPVHVAAYALLVALLVAAVRTGRIDPVVDRLGAACRDRATLFFTASLALFVAAGFAFRIDVPLLGDSWFLVTNFAGALRGTEEILPRHEPLATYYLSFVIGLFGVKTYQGFLTAFFAGGMVLGAGFLGTTFAATRLLFPEHRERAIAWLTVCSLPCLVLFFGYVETYAVVLFALSLYTLAGALYLRGRVPFVVPAVAFLLQALTHYLTVLTLPGLCYLAWIGLRRGKRNDVALGVGFSCVAFLLILIAIGFDVADYVSQVPHKHYLPLFTPDDQVERYSSPYTLFSPFHFLDLANLSLLLLAPAIGMVVVRFAMRRSISPGGTGGTGETSGARTANPARGDTLIPPPSDSEWFLLACVLPVALFGFVAKFDLGTARDWDVLGPYSFLFVLLALAWWFRRIPPPASTRILSVITLGTLLNGLLWWSVVGSDSPAVDRFRTLMDHRLNGQGGMYSASLYLSRYYRQMGRGSEESAELWLQYLLRYPGDIRAYRNVLTNTKEEGATAAADKIRGWSQAFNRNPLTDATMVTLALEWGNAALAENRDTDAELFFEAALDVDKRNAPAWNNLGTVHARREEYAAAAAMFNQAVELDPIFADAWFNLGRAWLATGRSTEARQAFSESARLGNRSARSLLSTGTVQP